MHRSLILALLLAALTGCPSADELFLTPNEAAALQDNLESSVEAQQQLSEFIFAAARGDLDLASSFDSYVYVPPSEANAWIGSLTITGGTFPFGTGDLRVDFSSFADGFPVDPYTFDLLLATQVIVDAQVVFDGLTNLGQSLSANADFTVTTVANGGQLVSSIVDGTFLVDHAGYVTDLVADNLQLGFDLLLGEITDVGGTLRGSVDIPDFVLDADFVITGLGDALEVALDAAATTIDYTLSLADLF